MPRGGSRPGAGRKAGAKNKRTVELEAATQVAAGKIAEAIDGAFAGDAHALLMTVYKDPAQEWPIRIDAAKAAIRFEKPALANIEQTVDGDMRHKVVSADPMTDESWERQFGEAVAGPNGAGHD